MFQSKNTSSIQENKLFVNLDINSLKLHYNPKDIINIQDGEIVFKTGDATEFLYLIIEGEVKIKVPGSKSNKIYKFLKNDFFGEKEILENTNRTSSAVANTGCILYPVKKSIIAELANKDEIFLSNLYRKNDSDGLNIISSSSIKGKDINDSVFLGNENNEVFTFDKKEDIAPENPSVKDEPVNPPIINNPEDVEIKDESYIPPEIPKRPIEEIKEQQPADNLENLDELLNQNSVNTINFDEINNDELFLSNYEINADEIDNSAILKEDTANLDIEDFNNIKKSVFDNQSDQLENNTNNGPDIDDFETTEISAEDEVPSESPEVSDNSNLESDENIVEKEYEQEEQNLENSHNEIEESSIEEVPEIENNDVNYITPETNDETLEEEIIDLDKDNKQEESVVSNEIIPEDSNVDDEFTEILDEDIVPNVDLPLEKNELPEEEEYDIDDEFEKKLSIDDIPIEDLDIENLKSVKFDFSSSPDIEEKNNQDTGNEVSEELDEKLFEDIEPDLSESSESTNSLLEKEVLSEGISDELLTKDFDLDLSKEQNLQENEEEKLSTEPEIESTERTEDLTSGNIENIEENLSTDIEDKIETGKTEEGAIEDFEIEIKEPFSFNAAHISEDYNPDNLDNINDVQENEVNIDSKEIEDNAEEIELPSAFENYSETNISEQEESEVNTGKEDAIIFEEESEPEVKDEVPETEVGNDEPAIIFDDEDESEENLKDKFAESQKLSTLNSGSDKEESFEINNIEEEFEEKTSDEPLFEDFVPGIDLNENIDSTIKNVESYDKEPLFEDFISGEEEQLFEDFKLDESKLNDADTAGEEQKSFIKEFESDNESSELNGETNKEAELFKTEENSYTGNEDNKENEDVSNEELNQPNEEFSFENMNFNIPVKKEFSFGNMSVPEELLKDNFIPQENKSEAAPVQSVNGDSKFVFEESNVFSNYLKNALEDLKSKVDNEKISNYLKYIEDQVKNHNHILESYNEYLTGGLSVTLSENYLNTVIEELLTEAAAVIQNNGKKIFKRINEDILMNIDKDKLKSSFYFLLKYLGSLEANGSDIYVSTTKREGTINLEFLIKEFVKSKEVIENDINQIKYLLFAKDILEKHKLDLNIIAVEGKGTIFRIKPEIPLS